MFRAQVLNLNDSTNAWGLALDKCKFKDPCYLPGYLKIFEELACLGEPFLSFMGDGTVFIFGDETNYIVYPFFKRKISEIPFAQGFNEYYDIISPYGYGGPLAQIDDKSIEVALWTCFYEEFEKYCQNNNIICEFARLHPIYSNHTQALKYSKGDVKRLGDLVYVDLSVDDDRILSGMSHQHRSNIHKAERNPDFTYRFNNGFPCSASFYTLYSNTMERKEADAKYRFPISFFESAAQNLGANLVTCSIIYKDQIIACMLMLYYGDIGYAWLAASSQEYFLQHPNEMLMFKTMIEARKLGCAKLLLGGGVGVQQDSLFRYKIGFSRLIADFYTYSKIFLPDAYRALVELKKHFSPDRTPGFFPEYRNY